MTSILKYGIALFAFVLVMHVAPLNEWRFYGDGQIFDLAHVGGFTVLAYLVTTGLQRYALTEPENARWCYLLAAVACLGTAVVAEAAQIWTNRDADIGDLLRDCSGIAGGLLLTAAFRGLRRWRRATAGLGLLVILGGMAMPASLLAAKIEALNRFPSLADFDGRLQMMLFATQGASLARVPAPPAFATTGFAARVTPRAGARFPALLMRHLPHDWRGYEQLSFRVATVEPGSALLRVRIDDIHYSELISDRFETRVPIDDMPKTVRIPLDTIARGPEDRLLDMAWIEQLLFYMTEADAVGFYVDQVQLE